MNGKYTYLDGKVIIEDENGKKKVVEYNNHLDEILVQENIIESLENELIEVNNDIERCQKLDKTNKNVTIFSAISYALIPIIMQFLLKLLLGENAIDIMVSTEPMMLPFIKGFITSITILSGSFFTIASYNAFKKNRKNINGQKSKRKVLEETIQQEKKELEQLHQTSQQQQLTHQFFEKEVDYLKELKRLRSYLNLYYDCGYNREKYIKYLQADKLYDKLEKYYTVRGIDLIAEYLESSNDANEQQKEQSGPVLVKRRTPPKHK